MQPSRLRSKLSQARGLGAAHHGVGHWWIQRLTALALIPLSLWFLVALLSVARSPDPFTLVDWLASPLNTVFLAAMLVALFWHSRLGVQVVIEDYVKDKRWKYALLFINTFLNMLGGLISMLAVLKLHMFHIVSAL